MCVCVHYVDSVDCLIRTEAEWIEDMYDRQSFGWQRVIGWDSILK